VALEKVNRSIPVDTVDMISPMAKEEAIPAARFLEGALLFTFAAHGLAMASMALLLLPGIPGGSTPDLPGRAAFVASHPWLWRLGWGPWQITAISDLLLSLALVATDWIDKPVAILSVLIMIAALMPDQIGQAEWISSGIHMAKAARQSGDYESYREFERRAFRLVAGWGTIGYLSAALCWTGCFAAAKVWSRRLTWLSVVTWTWFGLATCNVFLPDRLREMRVIGLIVGVGNGLGFVCLMLWLAMVDEQVLRRSRPDAEFGSRAIWRHPSSAMWARAAEVMANSRFVKAVGNWLPALAMSSDIRDVVFVNYLLPAQRLEPMIPGLLQLQRLGPDGRYAMFTFLTYRHGHFGPRLCGPLRRLWPSPIQSNWRLYVLNPRTGNRGVLFLTTAITGLPYALATRLLSHDVPMHIPAHAEINRIADGAIHVGLKPGAGSGPDCELRLRPSEELPLTTPWNECFGSFRQMLAYCVPQDRALTSQPWTGRVLRQEIELGIPLEKCRPMAGEVISKSAGQIAGEARPICFMVDQVRFCYFGETYDGPK
jgi:hypothetical protein